MEINRLIYHTFTFYFKYFLRDYNHNVKRAISQSLNHECESAEQIGTVNFASQ